mmetsp:Transcript_40598/g.128627  ORF Transcript_40598/g.128627 Transcript_40598/m.128627 type:complete len:265 (-) Transcript_40598:905-1699(-)
MRLWCVCGILASKQLQPQHRIARFNPRPVTSNIVLSIDFRRQSLQQLDDPWGRRRLLHGPRDIQQRGHAQGRDAPQDFEQGSPTEPRRRARRERALHRRSHAPGGVHQPCRRPDGLAAAARGLAAVHRRGRAEHGLRAGDEEAHQCDDQHGTSVRGRAHGGQREERGGQQRALRRGQERAPTSEDRHQVAQRPRRQNAEGTCTVEDARHHGGEARRHPAVADEEEGEPQHQHIAQHLDEEVCHHEASYPGNAQNLAQRVGLDLS